MGIDSGGMRIFTKLACVAALFVTLTTVESLPASFFPSIPGGGDDDVALLQEATSNDVASLTNEAAIFATSEKTEPHEEIMDDIQNARREGAVLGKLFNTIKANSASNHKAKQMMQMTDKAGFSINEWYKANEDKKIQGVTVSPAERNKSAFSVEMNLRESRVINKKALQVEVLQAAEKAKKVKEAEELDLAAYEIMRSNVMDKMKEMKKMEGK